MYSVTINGQSFERDGDGDMPLLWFIRDIAGLKGTKFGCGIGVCGACTIHLNGKAVRSCVVTFAAANGGAVTTIEGLDQPLGVSLKRAWIESEVPQCGYCQPGMIMAAAALLEQNPALDDATMGAEVTNICRCGTYNRIRRAIRTAAAGRANGA